MQVKGPSKSERAFCSSAVCQRTDRSADIAADIAEWSTTRLSSCLVGDRWSQLPSTHGSSQKVTPENPKVIGDDDLADVMNLSPEPTNELLRGRSAGCKQPSCLNGMHEFGDTEARGGVTARALS